MRVELDRSNESPSVGVCPGVGLRPSCRRSPLLDLSDPVLIVSAAGAVIDCNAAAAAIFGGPHGVIGMPVQNLLPFLQKGAAGDPPMHGVVRHAGGHDLHLDVTCSPLHGTASRGTVAYVLHDVSRHVEITHSREQLLFAVAHELRNPLGVIENALDELAEAFTDLSAAEIDELVRMAHASAIHLHGLMEALLSAGAIQSGRFTVHARPVPVAALIETALAQVQAALGRHSLHVRRDRTTERTPVLADLCFAGQALVNLLNNAIKYSPAGSTIRIRVEPADGQVRIAVSDRGAGIPPAHLDGIFDRFYRASNAGNKPGIGLGLAIVRGIAEAHGGTVGIESIQGAGTTVWFTLPSAITAV